MNLESLFIEADKYDKEYVKYRRNFHKYAEYSWTEFRTTSVIMDFLKNENIKFLCGNDIINPKYAWSYPSDEIIKREEERAISEGASRENIKKMNGYTGVVAIIDSGNPGPTYGFRFDIDAVMINEAKDENHRPYREGFSSQNKGAMHACGHDGHTTMGLFFAKIVNKYKDTFNGKVKIIFQPSEEGDKGAQSVVKSGIIDDLDTVCGIHILGTKKEAPALAATWKGLFATTKFDVEFFGKSAHAGMEPQEGHNAILAAVQSISLMQSFIQNSSGETRLNIGTIQGGTGRNVVPDYCKIEVETRGSTSKIEKKLYDACVKCVKNTAAIYGCSTEIKVMGYGPTGNGSTNFANQIVEAAKSVDELKWIVPFHNNEGGTDDFAYMMQHLQAKGKRACYLNLFTKLKGGIHNSHYDMDESCLKVGVKILLAVLNSLNEETL